nr:MAG TPA: peptidase [Caudoviricetes sp.]
MPNPVSAAIGTQRQFAIQPKSVYQSGIKPLSVGNGITQRTNQDAAALANALGIVGAAVNNEALAADRREREQFTALEAQKMIAGKTPEDLAKFDRIQALQHSDKGYDLTDNPYAMATLDQSIGQVAAASAKEKWATENTGTPKTINEAVQAYHGLLQDTYGSFKDSIKNSVSFDKGFYEGYQRDILQVANEAHTRINNEARSKGQRAINVKMQGLISSAGQLDTVSFAKSFGELARELQSYVKNSDEALKIIQGNLETLVENDVSTEKLNAIKDTAYYGADRKIGDELPLFKLYKKISENVNYKTADEIYEASKNKDGTINWEKAEAQLRSLPATVFSRGIPQVYLPQYSGDLDNLKPEFKAILPSVGGILSQLGYGDVAEYTSGYRDPARNAAAGGAETSYHLQGNAVDVYVGDLSTDEQETIKANFNPYFTEILYHDAGSGLHLHLAGYQGGLDDRADDTEATAAAYSPDRLDKIKKRLKAKDADAKRIVREQQQEAYENTVQAITQADSQEEALHLVDTSGLPLAKQNSLRRSINAKFKAINTGNLSVEDQFYLKYEKGKLWTDLATLKEYDRQMEDADLELDDKFQDKANAAARRINDYWKHCIPSYGKTAKAPNETPEEPADTPKEALIEEIKNQSIPQMIAQGMTRSDIEERLMLIAPRYGLDPATILDDLDIPDDIE